MATELGRKLLALEPSKIDKPVLARLLAELRGGISRSGGFNDNGRMHNDYVDNDTQGHTDFSQECLPSYSDSTPHTDLSYRDGRRYSHSDETDMCDSHTDSDPNHLWRWSYSDITR